MLKVPRHLFVSPETINYSYSDAPLPIDCAQTISQPFIVGFMTQEAYLNRNSKVLEIGTGSGYQAAILAEICGKVFTIERIEQLAKKSAVIFQQLGYSNLHTKVGDGYAGWPEEAPFDAIIVTAASKEIPETLLNQLAVGGRMIIPLHRRPESQVLVRITKTSFHEYHTKDLLDVRFVPMVKGIAH
jgi:protein-L-isoaspartate(D-aspartate) O-methyltransferase